MQKLTPLQLLEMAMKAHKWWEQPELPAGQKWETLEHNGLDFPEPYERLPVHVKLVYDGAPVELNAREEEAAKFYALVPPDGPQLGNPDTRKIFNKNFWRDFQKVMSKDTKKVLKKLDKCDFSLMRAWIAEDRERKKNRTKEEKAVAKVANDARKLHFQYTLVNGALQKQGNILVEPPSLFRGRGVHPKQGMIKQRVAPEQVAINCSEGACVPKCPVPGHAWSSVVHQKDVTWLATWKENINGATKYVYLAASSGFKGLADKHKYEKARRLKKCIGKIRKDYTKNLKSKDVAKRQRATAMWVIDRLALRVGGEKDEDEADTVGCCSLRVEHLTCERAAPEAGGADAQEELNLTMDFLGKDSMRHHQTYNLAKYPDVGAQVFKNFEDFMFEGGKRSKKKKDAEDQIFDELTVSDLNDHLKTLMPGLSAKVFRTYNASETLQNELPAEVDEDTLVAEKLVMYNKANRTVAILCNHQKTVSKGHGEAMDKLISKRNLLSKQIKALEKMLRYVRKGKEVATKTPGLTDKTQKAREAHLFGRQPSESQIIGRLDTFKERLAKQELAMRNKEENKTVSLGTSKINYMDPRVSVAWCKRHEMPVEKVFPSSIRDKFPWAMSVSSDWKF